MSRLKSSRLAMYFFSLPVKTWPEKSCKSRIYHPTLCGQCSNVCFLVPARSVIHSVANSLPVGRSLPVGPTHCQSARMQLGWRADERRARLRNTDTSRAWQRSHAYAEDGGERDRPRRYVTPAW